MPTPRSHERQHCPHCGWASPLLAQADLRLPHPHTRCPQCQHPQLQTQSFAAWQAKALRWLGAARFLKNN